MLPERSGINKNATKLEASKQPPYVLIYTLGLVELETLKTYIKTNLPIDFIQTFKSPAGTPILFVYKPNNSFRLCINY